MSQFKIKVLLFLFIFLFICYFTQTQQTGDMNDKQKVMEVLKKLGWESIIKMEKQCHMLLHKDREVKNKYFYIMTGYKVSEINKNLFCVGDFGYMVYGFFLETELFDDHKTDTPDNYFIVLDVFVINTGLKPQSIPKMYLVDQRGARYKDWELSTIDDFWVRRLYESDVLIDFFVELNPGQSKKWLVIFDVPNKYQYSLRVFGKQSIFKEEGEYIDIPIKSLAKITLDFIETK